LYANKKHGRHLLMNALQLQKSLQRHASLTQNILMLILLHKSQHYLIMENILQVLQTHPVQQQHQRQPEHLQFTIKTRMHSQTSSASTCHTGWHSQQTASMASTDLLFGQRAMKRCLRAARRVQQALDAQSHLAAFATMQKTLN